MSWNYRVVERESRGEKYYFIIEAYYDRSGKVLEMWCEASPGGNSPEELRADLDLMLKASKRPIIREQDLPGYVKPAPSTKKGKK